MIKKLVLNTAVAGSFMGGAGTAGYIYGLETAPREQTLIQNADGVIGIVDANIKLKKDLEKLGHKNVVIDDQFSVEVIGD